MSNLDQDPQAWAAEQFEYEYCAECGGDADDHDIVPFLGNWFARCKLFVLTEDQQRWLREAIVALNNLIVSGVRHPAITEADYSVNSYADPRLPERKGNVLQ